MIKIIITVAVIRGTLSIKSVCFTQETQLNVDRHQNPAELGQEESKIIIKLLINTSEMAFIFALLHVFLHIF